MVFEVKCNQLYMFVCAALGVKGHCVATSAMIYNFETKLHNCRPANHFCLHAWDTGSECLENVSDAWNSATDLKLKGI